MTVLHRSAGDNDGAYPNGGLAMDRTGVLYGTTDTRRFRKRVWHDRRWRKERCPTTVQYSRSLPRACSEVNPRSPIGPFSDSRKVKSDVCF